MDKYYTPEIEEFHVGFEYEYLNEDGEWEKVKSPVTISEDGYNEQAYGLRVKYLDQEDIESLGFVKWPDRDNYDLGEFQLHTNRYTDPTKVEIYNEHSQTAFIGTIKNKSELVKVLKMVGYAR